MNNREIIAGVLKRDFRSIARAITIVESFPESSREISAELYALSGKAQVIGVTGSPGAGKSTLVDKLISKFRADQKRVAVLAVDPTSPFSGGAILGDRIRMDRSSEDDTVFIRSMATRGALGGLPRAAFEAVTVLDAAGFDIIIIETVGVGQVEVDVVKICDTCLVVLVPGMGDTVQVFKAGILEIADIFVINKSERDGVELLHRDLNLLLSLDERAEAAWQKAIIRTNALNSSGVDQLVAKIYEHRTWYFSDSSRKIRRERSIKDVIVRMYCDQLIKRLETVNPERFSEIILHCQEKKIDPFLAVEELLKLKLFNQSNP
jgi:LAO/AO transport system kinase